MRETKNKRFGQLLEDTAKYPRFKKLLKEGISSVAKRQLISEGEVKLRIAEELGFSHHTVQHWLRGYIPKEVAHVTHLVRYFVNNGRVDRAWADSFLYQADYPDREILLDEWFPSQKSPVRIFISYERDAERDQSVALKIAQALTDANYAVFFDQESQITQQSVERLQGELSQADRVIFLFSADSIHSEVVLRQLEMVQAMGQEGRVGVLPVWLGSSGFAQAEHPFLSSLNWALWQREEDTPQLINDLKQAVMGGQLPLTAHTLADLCAASEDISSRFPFPIPSTEPIQWSLQDGALPVDCNFYVEREADRLAHETIVLPKGVTITIKGARQMGKSSLLQRLSQTARQHGKHFVWLDCQLLHGPQKESQSFFHNLCDAFADEVGLENPAAQRWSTQSPQQNCTRYVGREILPRLEQPCVLALDSAESLFDTTYSEAFFGMLRNWHNQRAHPIKKTWGQLDLVVVTSTEPYFFIKDMHKSPFNVGQVIELQDFTPSQVSDLNQRHGAPLTATEEAQLMSLLHGHPYLVRRALYLVASQRMTASKLFAQKCDERGPFGDHLRALLWLLQSHSKELRAAMLNVLREQSCPDSKTFFRLRGAGLVRGDSRAVVPRCPLYADFLREYLNE